MTKLEQHPVAQKCDMFSCSRSNCKYSRKDMRFLCILTTDIGGMESSNTCIMLHRNQPLSCPTRLHQLAPCPRLDPFFLVGFVVYGAPRLHWKSPRRTGFDRRKAFPKQSRNDILFAILRIIVMILDFQSYFVTD